MFPRRRPDCQQVFRHTVQAFLVVVFVMISSQGLRAGQITYKLGLNADVTGGGSGPEITSSAGSSNSTHYVGFYGTYPSIHLDARGERSSFVSSYTFGYDKYASDPGRETRSHAASVTYSTKFSPKWDLNAADSFSTTSDISTFRLLGGITTDPDQFQFAFTPVFARSNQNNTASLSVNRTINQRSSLSFSGSYSTLFYPGGPAISSVVSDQKRIAATVTYSHSSEHNTWSLGYSGARFNFVSFQNSLNHSAIFGFSHKFSAVLSFRIDAGPSYLESLDSTKSPVGANVTAALERKVQKGSFALILNQSSGDSSGLGSVSSYRRATIAMGHTFARRTTVSANVSAFDTQGLQLNSASARGVAAGGSVGFGIGRDWSINWGGQYQHYEGYSSSGYDQNRVFVSLRYVKPELWRFQR